MQTINQAIITEISRQSLTRAQLDSRIVDGYRINRLCIKTTASTVQNLVSKLIARKVVAVDENNVLSIADDKRATGILSKPANAGNYTLSPFDQRLLSLPWSAHQHRPSASNKFRHLFNHA